MNKNLLEISIAILLLPMVEYSLSIIVLGKTSIIAILLSIPVLLLLAMLIATLTISEQKRFPKNSNEKKSLLELEEDSYESIGAMVISATVTIVSGCIAYSLLDTGFIVNVIVGIANVFVLLYVSSCMVLIYKEMGNGKNIIRLFGDLIIVMLVTMPQFLLLLLVKYESVVFLFVFITIIVTNVIMSMIRDWYVKVPAIGVIASVLSMAIVGWGTIATEFNSNSDRFAIWMSLACMTAFVMLIASEKIRKFIEAVSTVSEKKKKLNKPTGIASIEKIISDARRNDNELE